ncbi:c-type cytochrome [Hydrogenophaga aquatica]
MPATNSPANTGRLRWLWWLFPLALAALTAWVFWPAKPIAVSAQAASQTPADAALIERGRYLATLGNCQGCHSLPGQPPYAGGTAVPTPFGTVYGPNLTPSAQGLGGWSASDFWRALHFGQAPGGRWLSPAFPYTNTTHVSREDSDALFAFLQTLPPDDTPSRPSELRWPYNTQAALKVWRALYFKPAAEQASAPGHTDEIARGRYLVQGLGHCSACHAPRDGWGGARDALALTGGTLPSGWYAPSLHDTGEAGVQGWALEDVVRLLGQGRSGSHVASGPMAEVVALSMRHWQAEDLRAVAAYLAGLPTLARPQTSRPAAANNATLGARLYDKHCASCHGEQGQGFQLANGQMGYPALAGNRTVTMDSPANLAQIVMDGGFGLATPDLPRPFGMPPFLLELDDTALAALLTHLRSSWGHQSSPVTELDIHRLRSDHGR